MRTAFEVVGDEVFEARHAVGATEAGKLTVLVAFTGRGRAKDREDATRAGFDAHIPKPMDLLEFVDRVRFILTIPPTTGTICRPPLSGLGPMAESGDPELTGIHVLVVDDPTSSTESAQTSS